MSVARSDSLGATRICPHCKATVLASSAICPACQHHLRFNAVDAKPGVAGYPALRVEGTFKHPIPYEAAEYCVVITVNNAQGEKITRQIVNVGALQAGEARTVSLSVEVLPAKSGNPRR